ncbi:MAG TPA: FGGY-family carbohydrate kinase [Candidatus Dormibacteraeota bacterium]|nr:FGGY-family carbohydrate kinase [Candidatus Dormibacteraeota bacterium]
MRRSANNAALAAVDLGAQSCRVSLLRWIDGNPLVEVVHRFPNSPVVRREGIFWDIQRILDGTIAGLRKCGEISTEGIAAVGVDGWAVDYVRLGGDGRPLADPFCHRDTRTRSAQQQLHHLLPPDKLYSLTGIQVLSLNTLYQLFADKQAGLDSGNCWLNLPEYITYCLGGRPVAEYTNATHTQLVRRGSHEWSKEIFQTAGLDLAAAPEIVPSGSAVGVICGDLGNLPAFRETRLIVPACHDTASAISAIPATGDDWAFISSGTWSLVGTVLNTPCVTEEAQSENFTNLGGVGGTTCFLKNVNGMWLLQQCVEEWEKIGFFLDMPRLLGECEALPAPNYLINVNDPELFLPGDMPGKINQQLCQAGHAPISSKPQDIPRMANLIFHSLAARYAEVLRSVAKITGKRLKRLFIVGGGSKNSLLNRLTAERTGLEVLTGSAESSTIGNLAIQQAALDGDWDESVGVTAASVAKWTQALALEPALLPADDQRD